MVEALQGDNTIGTRNLKRIVKGSLIQKFDLAG
jgi:hypothetical protein